ncbi:MAG: molybdopterin-dependent oxidoreductase [Akkermansiaceae bacterium]|nr:molybdopterin-dependent oxidoreductase [Akkermansiaceae bacterium]
MDSLDDIPPAPKKAGPSDAAAAKPASPPASAGPETPGPVLPAQDRRGADLYACLLTSPHAAATIASRDAAAAKALPGVVDIFFASDLDDRNRLRPLRPDEPLLAEGAAYFWGQPVAVIVALDEASALAARDAVRVDYHPAQSILDVEHAIAMQSYHGDAVSISRGDPEKAITEAPHRFAGKLDIGSQLPLPRDTLSARAVPDDDGGLAVWTAAEVPSRVRTAVAAGLKIPESQVALHGMPIAGATGGRQTEAALVATLAALAAQRARQPVALRIDPAAATALTAKRHAVRASFRAGYDNDGRLLSADVELSIDGGWIVGDSNAALDQMILHADGAYFVPHFRVTGRLCRTHHVTGAALPAEGAAQGSLVMEEILTRIANRLGLSPAKVRDLNLYRETGNRHSTHYGQPVDCEALQRVWNTLIGHSEFEARRERIDDWNRQNPCYKRGIAAVPVKFGLGDTRSDRNQAMVLIQLLLDGSVCVRLGCIDNGDGLPLRIAEEAARQFGIPAHGVSVRCGDPNLTPHMTARIGANTVSLMRRAVADACDQLKQRLRPIAAQLLAAGGMAEIDAETIRFAGGRIAAGGQSTGALTFADLVEAAWRRRANMSAIGFHRTPNLWWDREVGAGWPFSAFIAGAAVVEIQLDAFTGEVQILRADLMHQGGPENRRAGDAAQIGRALTFGFGWMLREAVAWSKNGALATDSPGDTPIPGFGDAPPQFHLEIATGPPNSPIEDAVASGAESAVFLAAAAREAVREAIRAFGADRDRGVEVDLPVPATPEAVLRALREMSRQLAASAKAKQVAAAEAKSPGGGAPEKTAPAPAPAAPPPSETGGK